MKRNKGIGNKNEVPGRLNTEKISQDSNPSTFSRDGSDMTAKRPAVYIKTFGWSLGKLQ